MGIVNHPGVLGAGLVAGNSAEVSLVETDGMTQGTQIFNVTTGSYFQLVASSAALSATVLAVLGTTGARWVEIAGTSPGGAVTFADLADTTVDSGATLIGVNANGGMFSEPDLQHVLQEDVVLKVPLAVTDGTGGASLVGIQDTGGYFAGTTVEAALQNIGAAGYQTKAAPSAFTLGSGQTIASVLADAGTNTAPATSGVTHTTSGTAAAGFGVLDFVDLESAGGTTRRVMTDTTKLTTATNAAEIASRIIQLMTAGALVDALDIRPNQTLFKAGTTALPGVAIGDPGYGIQQDTANVQLRLCMAGTVGLYVGASGMTINSATGYLELSSSSDATLRSITNGGTRKIQLDSASGAVVGALGALATNATAGFLWIPSCAGTPTGTPETISGKVAMVYDTTNNKFYIYNGAWKGGTVPGAFV